MWMKNPVLRVVVLGCHDSGSPLRLLRGHRSVLELIFARLLVAWEAHVDTTTHGFLRLGRRAGTYGHGRLPRKVTFPPRWGRGGKETPLRIIMMPFVMGDATSLPPSCRRYQTIIETCLRASTSDERGKVGYITIHEGNVEAGTSQLRTGLCIETGGGSGTLAESDERSLGWSTHHRLYGGIFVASSVANSFAVCDAVLQDTTEFARACGDAEHLRPALAKRGVIPQHVDRSELIWMTDRTPHESLPLAATAFHQFFSLTTSGVLCWDADRWTPNPLGIQSACKRVHSSAATSSQRPMKRSRTGTS
ncbi:hypothetical protein H310_08677 [Aphanomyces invadans]|uniref:Uncharacterized protein n=1 Tax=Aphanomyces invadans TaxID=157072 RepID=A0A024TX07_9STRA|nr:hypothetical protein H310_08677 [Aphanomyces invadans]ETV98553.1 hypothetical protein H310_08677 [Aphanomyces invadans]|eukprot:XP_008872750.1 hypothetical protein H310_08677 [Aphanomyces invadans]